MDDQGQSEVSQIFQAIRGRQPGAEKRLFELAYDELRRMAGGRMAREKRSPTYLTSDLVQDAYLRICRGDDANWENRRHFFGAAVIAMRRILVDRARKKQAEIGGGKLVRVTLDEALPDSDQPLDLLALDTALDRLAETRPRPAEVVGYRYFIGMTVKQTAELLEVSPKTVDNDWALAKAWLRREMERTPADDPPATSA